MSEVRGKTAEETLHREIALLAQPLARLAYERIELSERIDAIEKERAAYSKMASDFAAEKQKIADENRALREDAHADRITIESAAQALSSDGYTGENSLGRQVHALVEERKTLSAAMARLVTAAGAIGPVEVETLVEMVKRGATPPPPPPLPGDVHATLRELLALPPGAPFDMLREVRTLVAKYERAGRHLDDARKELTATKEALSKETERTLAAERALRDVVNVLDGVGRHVGASWHPAVLAAQALFDRHVALEEEVANLRALAPGAVRGDLLSSLRDALGLKPTDDTATVLRAFRERLDANAKPASPASTYTPQAGDLVDRVFGTGGAKEVPR